MKKYKRDIFKIKQIKDAYYSGYIEGYKTLAFELLMDINNGLSFEKFQEKLKDNVELWKSK